MREQERGKTSTVRDGEMINVFPEAETPGMGRRECCGTGRGNKEVGNILFAKEALFLEGLINSKITFYPSSAYTKGNIQPGCTSAGRGECAIIVCKQQ